MWLHKGHLAFDHCLVQQLAQGLIHPQDVGEAMVTLQKLEPSGVAHSYLCVERRRDELLVVGLNVFGLWCARHLG